MLHASRAWEPPRWSWPARQSRRRRVVLAGRAPPRPISRPVSARYQWRVCWTQIVGPEYVRGVERAGRSGPFERVLDGVKSPAREVVFWISSSTPGFGRRRKRAGRPPRATRSHRPGPVVRRGPLARIAPGRSSAACDSLGSPRGRSSAACDSLGSPRGRSSAACHSLGSPRAGPACGPYSSSRLGPSQRVASSSDQPFRRA